MTNRHGFAALAAAGETLLRRGKALTIVLCAVLVTLEGARLLSART